MPKKGLLLLFALMFANVLMGQQKNLLQSRHRSYYTFVYRITNQEARRICKKSIECVNKNFLHTKVDSVKPGNHFSELALPQGNYLAVKVIENKVEYELFTVKSYSLEVMENSRDLCVQLLDTAGRIKADLELFFRNKRVPFDPITKLYRLQNVRKSGILDVRSGGASNYYALKNKFPTSLLRRTYRSVCYGPPLKYLFIPVYNTIKIPVDEVRGLLGYGHRFSWRPFINAGRSIAYCYLPRHYERHHQRYSGYLVFNKPFFRPADTLRFKSFLVNSISGKPLEKPLGIYLQKRYEYNHENAVFLGDLLPGTPGAYWKDIVLSDSLKLILDHEYSVVLKETGKKRKSLIEQFFEYRDYELKRTQIHFSVSSKIHYRNTPLKILAEARDDNGMPVPDCRINLRVKPGTVTKLHKEKIFIPELLWQTSQPMQNGIIAISIPDSIFPAADFEYSIEAEFFTADNEKIERDTLISYIYEPVHFLIEALNDSIVFSCS